MFETILIVDSEAAQLRMVEHAVQQKLHYHTAAVNTGAQAVERIVSGRSPVDLLLLDMSMQGADGMQVIREVRACRPELPIIVFTPYGDDALAGLAVEAGANDFLSKPVVIGRLRISLQNALKIQCMSGHIARLERRGSGHVTIADVVGQSQSMKEALAQAQQAASSKMPVWIEGERGTGKELLARAIHGGSDRAGKPFVFVNCAALTEDIAESILFGQETAPGKLQFALGKLREAEQGTLLLKDVGALKPALQSRLLEVLDRGAVQPLGSAKPVPLNVRLMCASSERIDALAAQGRFNSELYRRLNCITIHVPPLRERKGDIPLLAQHIISVGVASENHYGYHLTEQAMQALMAGSWPGNVRQLSMLLSRAMILCENDLIDAGDLRAIRKAPPAFYTDRSDDALMQAGPVLLDVEGRVKKLKSIEDEVICFALRYYGGCMTRAARSLGIGRSTLYRRVNELENSGYISRANHTTRPMMKVSSSDRT